MLRAPSYSTLTVTSGPETSTLTVTVSTQIGTGGQGVVTH
jgi:hypothetical protein